MADLARVDDGSLCPGALRSRQRHMGSQWHRNELWKGRHLQLVLWEELQAGEGGFSQQQKAVAAYPLLWHLWFPCPGGREAQSGEHWGCL